MIGHWHRRGAKHSKDSKESPRGAPTHNLEEFLPEPASGKDPVVGLLFPMIEGFDNVVPEVFAIVVHNGVGATRGELDRVEQKAEVSGGIHADSGCGDLNRKTGETFLFRFNVIQSGAKPVNPGVVRRVSYTMEIGALPRVGAFNKIFTKSCSTPNKPYEFHAQ